MTRPGGLWTRWWRRIARIKPAQRRIPDALWQATLAAYPFLIRRGAVDAEHLRALAGAFLADKEFHGAGGLTVTDAMAVAIAAQACLPLVRVRARPDGRALDAGSPLIWYRDFVGIVVQPGDVVAHRETMDESGVVHHYDEVLAGEAMEQGPVMLSWPAVAEAGASSSAGFNVVIHEFAHKLDMASGAPDGCPPLPAGFMGTRTPAAARKAWLAAWEPAYADFCERVVIAERFGGKAPWLDAYGSQSLDEFFAVACEAYFVNREKFSAEWPALLPMMNEFFEPESA